MLRKKYKVNVTHSKAQNSKVLYIVNVKSDSSAMGEKISKKRYSELKEFNDQLIKVVGQLKIQVQLPEFPKRRLFGSTNKSEDSIINRQIELQVYFNELFSIEKVLSIPLVKDYLPDEQFIIEENGIEGNGSFKQIIQVKIERYSIYEDVVIYYMKFVNLMNSEEWIFQQRYSELRSLNEAILNMNLKTKIPVFPQRKLFRVTNENPEDIEKRREDLQIYLNQLLSIEEVYNCSAIQYFVADSRRSFEKTSSFEKMKRQSSTLDKNIIESLQPSEYDKKNIEEQKKQ